MTDPQGHAAATSLVTAGTVLLGSVKDGQFAAAQADLRAVAANEPVEDAVRVIRDQLDLPAPDTS